MKKSLPIRCHRWISDNLDKITQLRILLLLSVLWCLAHGLVVITPSAKSGWLGTTTFLAVLLGWLLGRSRRSLWVSFMIVFLFGPVWMCLSAGELADPLVRVLVSFAHVLFDFFHPPHQPDFSSLLLSVSTLVQSIGDLFARFPMWFKNIQAGSPVRDPTVEGFLWGLGIWIAACWAAWWLRRRSLVEVALLPVALLFIVPIYFIKGKEYLPWLVFFAGGWVLIQAVEHYAVARHRWQENNMDRVEIEPGLAGSVAFITVVAMLAGGFIPGISMDKLQDAWDDLFDKEERITEGTGEGSPGSTEGYTSYMKISAGQELPADIILYVRVDGYIPPEPSDRGRSGEAQQPEKQYYWRNATYSTYNGTGWSNYTSREQEYPARSLVYPDSENRLETYDYVTQSVERLNPADEAVYFTGDLLSVDQPFVVSWRKYDDPIKSTTPADRYTSVSRLPRATIPQLREVGNELPAVIRDRYLQLPAGLPNRVRDLALDLTVGMDNSYDRASVIQNYLRQFPYNLDVPAPPAGRDAVDFFLFDLQQGYCNYFASAMTVLARSAGLPARLVTGYRTGGYDYSNQRFIIREQNSHAWVEVYFYGIGWVEFEPTSGVPILPHPGGTTVALPPTTPAPVDTTLSLTRFFWSAIQHPLALVSLLAALTLVIFLFPLRDWILYLQPAEKALTTIFKRLYRQGRRWGIPSDASRTPSEFCRLLSSRLEISTRENLSNDLQTLTRLYSLQLFSPMAPVRRDIQQAIGIWIRLRRTLHRTPRRIRSERK